MQETIKPPLRRQKRPLRLLVISFCALIALVALVYFFQPTAHVSLAVLQIPILPFFFFLLFFFFYALGTYLFKSRRHGLLLASFVVIYLLFRLNNLIHPFFFILLAALFLTVELLFSYRKE